MTWTSVQTPKTKHFEVHIYITYVRCTHYACNHWNTLEHSSRCFGFPHVSTHSPTNIGLPMLPSLENHQSWPRPRAPVLFKLCSTLADTCPSKTLGEKIWWDLVYIRENHQNLPNILLCGLCCPSHERILEMYLSYLQYLVSAQSVFTFLIFRHSLWYPALTKPRPWCTYASPLAPNPIAATSRVLEENLNHLSELEVSLALKVRWYKQIAI